MKMIVTAVLAAAVSLFLAGCRGNNSTYTTAQTTAMTTQSTTAPSQTQTPTINNGNGPVTTASTEPLETTMMQNETAAMPSTDTAK